MASLAGSRSRTYSCPKMRQATVIDHPSLPPGARVAPAAAPALLGSKVRTDEPASDASQNAGEGAVCARTLREEERAS